MCPSMLWIYLVAKCFRLGIAWKFYDMKMKCYTEFLKVIMPLLVFRRNCGQKRLDELTGGPRLVLKHAPNVYCRNLKLRQFSTNSNSLSVENKSNMISLQVLQQLQQGWISLLPFTNFLAVWKIRKWFLVPRSENLVCKTSH